jgi:hypothetical protein
MVGYSGEEAVGQSTDTGSDQVAHRAEIHDEVGLLTVQAVLSSERRQALG